MAERYQFPYSDAVNNMPNDTAVAKNAKRLAKAKERAAGYRKGNYQRRVELGPRPEQDRVRIRRQEEEAQAIIDTLPPPQPYKIPSNMRLGPMLRNLMLESAKAKKDYWMCLICCEEPGNETMFITKCGHPYCEDCLSKWLTKKMMKNPDAKCECPTCKEPM